MATDELKIEIDDRLLARFQAGDAQAFDSLVAVHTDRLFAIAYEILRQREDAEEVTQEVLVILYREMSAARAPRNLRPWLYRVCLNTCINRQRARKRRPATFELTEEIPAPAISDPANLEYEFTFQDRVRAAVENLPKQQRMAFTLCHFAGLSATDIGEALRCRPATVRVHLSRAAARLRAVLSKELMDDESL